MQLPSGFSGGIFFVPRGCESFFWGAFQLGVGQVFPGEQSGCDFFALEVLGYLRVVYIVVC